jgi:capsular exopolysaccharide synthesis family protein
MSRIYRALEKAEEEKRQEVKEEPSLKVFEEKSLLKKEPPPLKSPEEKVEKWELPPKEEGSVLIIQPDSFGEEEFRKLKTQIFLRSPNPPHSILVTSTAPEEGKTMVAVNLSRAISREIHKNAILIDGDLRKPGIHLERSQNAKGLSNYLLDGTPLSEILVNSEMENLQVIMAGPSTPKSSELIGSKRMAELLKSLREFGDNTYIVIDSPPIMSTSEPALLSKIADGIILVVRSGHTPRESIQRAIKCIDHQKIIGVVFNRIDIKPSGYYSEYYRYYQRYKKQS